MGIFHLPTHKSFKFGCLVIRYTHHNHIMSLLVICMDNFMRFMPIPFVNLCTNDRRMYPSPDRSMPLIIIVYHFESFISVCAFVSHVNGWFEVELNLWSECLYFIFFFNFFSIRFHLIGESSQRTSNRINTVDVPTKLFTFRKSFDRFGSLSSSKMKTFLVSIW